MPRTSRLDLAIPCIESYFNSRTTKAYNQLELLRALQQSCMEWQVPQSTSVERFIKFLLMKTPMKEVRFGFPDKPEQTRYLWGNATPFECALSISPKSYLSHGSAMEIHKLAHDYPTRDRVYVNVEQSPKSSADVMLSQEAITASFSKAPRTSNRIAVFENTSYYVLNGRNTGRLGVVETKLLDGTTVRVTDLERTLIDIAVRPFYAGGIAHVFAAYQRARGKTNVAMLIDMLKKLNFVYPYHQVIGFLLEKSGFPKEQTEPLRDLGLEFDFYADYQMNDSVYVPEWRLHYPK